MESKIQALLYKIYAVKANKAIIIPPDKYKITK